MSLTGAYYNLIVYLKFTQLDKFVVYKRLANAFVIFMLMTLHGREFRKYEILKIKKGFSRISFKKWNENFMCNG